MTAALVPAATPIKRSRVVHMDKDRLYRRRSHLVWLLTEGGHTLDGRPAFAVRAVELVCIEDELQKRHLLSTAARHTNWSPLGQTTHCDGGGRPT